MQLKNLSNREQFAKKFVREGEILKNALAKLPTRSSANFSVSSHSFKRKKFCFVVDCVNFCCNAFNQTFYSTIE